MKKVNTETLEKMAKDKNIDKNKIETLANNYKSKSENELIEELIKVGKNLEGKEEVVSKIRTVLNDEQKKKLDSIMEKINENSTPTKKVKKELEKLLDNKKGTIYID